MSLPLTPDLCARALIASAATYGDDPALALTLPRARGEFRRRCVAPATLAIVHATRCNRTRICVSMSVDYYSISQVDRSPGGSAAYAAAMAALGCDPAAVSPSRFGPKRKAAYGTDRAPPPVPLKAPPAPPTKPAAPKPAVAASRPAVPARPPVDHTDAIKAAIARRQAAASMSSPDTCAWPKGGSGMVAEEPCSERAVQGRLYCPEHCRRLGQKDTPVLLGPAEMPARYTDRATA